MSYPPRIPVVFLLQGLRHCRPHEYSHRHCNLAPLQIPRLSYWTIVSRYLEELWAPSHREKAVKIMYIYYSLI